MFVTGVELGTSRRIKGRRKGRAAISISPSSLLQLGTLGHRRPRLQMEQLPGWGWGLLKLPGPGGSGGALVVAGSSCPYLAFLSRLGVAQQTRDRHISSVTREPVSWPHPCPDELDV